MGIGYCWVVSDTTRYHQTNVRFCPKKSEHLPNIRPKKRTLPVPLGLRTEHCKFNSRS